MPRDEEGEGPRRSEDAEFKVPSQVGVLTAVGCDPTECCYQHYSCHCDDWQPYVRFRGHLVR